MYSWSFVILALLSRNFSWRVDTLFTCQLVYLSHCRCKIINLWKYRNINRNFFWYYPPLFLDIRQGSRAISPFSVASLPLNSMPSHISSRDDSGWWCRNSSISFDAPIILVLGLLVQILQTFFRLSAQSILKNTFYSMFCEPITPLVLKTIMTSY